MEDKQYALGCRRKALELKNCPWGYAHEPPLEWNVPSSRSKPIEGGEMGGGLNEKLDCPWDLLLLALGYQNTTQEHLC